VSGSVTPTFQYAGYYAHQGSGLNLTWYRGYDPVIGRWLARDPLPDAEKLQGMNHYVYVTNSPFDFYDPLGLYSAYDFLDDASNFSAGAGDAFSLGITGAIRNSLPSVYGSNGGVDRCSVMYASGEVAGSGLGFALGGSAALRAGAEISMANRGNAVGKWMSQGRYWRLGASGARQTPTLRIGAARPPTPLNHIDLTFFGK